MGRASESRVDPPSFVRNFGQTGRVAVMAKCRYGEVCVCVYDVLVIVMRGAGVTRGDGEGRQCC